MQRLSLRVHEPRNGNTMNRKLTWLASLLALALMVLGSPRDTALGAKAIPVDTGTYAHTSQGYDISFPQCELGFPDTPFAYGIVGVTHGHAFTYNPCLHDEFVWAQQADAAPSFYMNLNYAVGWSAGHGLSGPRETARPLTRRVRLTTTATTRH